MALANNVRTCSKNVSGNRKEIYIASSGTATVLEETAGEITTLTAAADSFKRVEADIDSLQITTEGAFSTSGGYTQNLAIGLSMPSTALNTLIDELTDGVACGFEIIWIDGNAKVWLAGVSVASKEGSARPFNKLATSFDSGIVMTDEGMQKETLTFTRVTSVRPVRIQDLIAATITLKTAAFIDW